MINNPRQGAGVLGPDTGGARYTLPPNKRVRFLFAYDRVFRPIFWVSIGRDGSLYLGPRYENPTVAGRRVVKSTEGKADFKYNDFVPVADDDGTAKPKVSIHASGVIHAVGDRAFRPTLRGITNQSQICMGIFEHPVKFHPVDKADRYDIAMEYPISESQPYWCSVHVAPTGKEQLFSPTGAVNTVNFLFDCTGLKIDPADIVVQVTFSHGPAGPWPKESGLIFNASFDPRANTGLTSSA